MKLPASLGAPYTFQQRTGGESTTGSALLGDVWVLAGQSNMEGVGLLQDTEPPHPDVHSFGSREIWGQAQEPLHDLAASPRPVHARLMAEAGWKGPVPKERMQGAGLGLSFARLLTGNTDVPIGLIPCAHGGTSMQQWTPQNSDPQHSLYGAMLDRIRLCGGKVAGVVWYQGESDTGSDDWPLYEQRMTGLLSALRRDLAQPELPFLMVQLGRFVASPLPDVTRGWDEIRQRQRRWASQQAQVEIVAALDLGLDDAVHIDTAGLRRLGRRLARAAAGRAGLQPAALHHALNPVGGPSLHLKVSGVTGELRSEGRPLGFELRSEDGQTLPIIFKVELHGDEVRLYLSEALPEGTVLGYGLGLDPAVNIVDHADNALLAFGGLRPALEPSSQG